MGVSLKFNLNISLSNTCYSNCNFSSHSFRETYTCKLVIRWCYLELTIHYFRTGTPEEWLRIRAKILEVITGQNLTTGAQRFTMVRRVLQGDALAAFNHTAIDAGAETVGIRFPRSDGVLPCHQA